MCSITNTSFLIFQECKFQCFKHSSKLTVYVTGWFPWFIFSMIVKMPFSKLPKARQLKRALENYQKEVTPLRKELRKTPPTDLRPTAISSPHRAVIEILTSVNVTPNAGRVRALLPLTETTSCVRKAPFHVTKTVFKAKLGARGYSKLMRYTIAISREYTSNSKKRTSVRASLARSQQTLVVEYLKRPSNCNELPSKKNKVRGNGVFGLTDTMQNLQRKFGMDHPYINISLSVFCLACPKYIHLIKYTARRQCLCQNHANVALMVDVVSVLPKITSTPSSAGRSGKNLMGCHVHRSPLQKLA